RRELGGACCAFYRGEKVVDLWGGIRNKQTGEPWEQRSEEHTSELQSHRDLHSSPTRRSSDLDASWVAPVVPFTGARRSSISGAAFGTSRQANPGSRDRKSTRLNSSPTEIYTLPLHDALPISTRVGWRLLCLLPGREGRRSLGRHSEQADRRTLGA